MQHKDEAPPSTQHRPSSNGVSPRHRVVIRASSGWASLRLRELWEYRELLYFLIWRDILLRYKQTAFGVAWVLLQPLATTALFSVLLGIVAKLPSRDAPYPVFVMAGFVPWTFFSSGVMRASVSLVANSNLVTKIYFPRGILPAAAVLAGLVDMAIVLGLLGAFVAFYGIVPSANVALAPVFLVMTVLATLGAGFWLSALNVRFRDVGAVIPFLTQLWLYVTPVIYPVSIVPEAWHAVYGLNPIACAVSGFRWTVFGGDPPSIALLASSTAASLLVFVSGVLVFRRVERTFADVV